MKLYAVLAVAVIPIISSAQSSTTAKEVDAVYRDAHALYLDIHQNPELSGHETQTAAKLAARLRNLGYEVTEHVGGTGVVALLKNGAGPTVMFRTELDALPVQEKTGAYGRAFTGMSAAIAAPPIVNARTKPPSKNFFMMTTPCRFVSPSGS